MIRSATRADLDWMVDWAAREGWNPGLDDADVFFETDPGGFFVSEAGGRPVACISVVNHTPDYAFLGFYICDPGWRGRGIGLGLWRAAMAHAGTRTIGLDGVADQQENYARSGFVLAGATTRFEGILLPTEPTLDCRPVKTPDAPALLALDAKATGIARDAFITGWIQETATRRTVVSSDARGFATARACREGIKIGPVVAPDVTSALGLITAASRTFDAELAYIDLPDGQPLLRKALENRGFSPVFATARMYLGTAPTGHESLRAVATLELG